MHESTFPTIKILITKCCKRNDVFHFALHCSYTGISALRQTPTPLVLTGRHMVTSLYHLQPLLVRLTTTPWTSISGKTSVTSLWSNPTSTTGSLARKEQEVWWNSKPEVYSVASSKMLLTNATTTFQISLSLTLLGTPVACPWVLIWFALQAMLDWKSTTTLMAIHAPTGLPMILVAVTPIITSPMSPTHTEIFT